MTAADLVRLLTTTVFLAAFLGAAVSAARSHRRESIDAALFFGAVLLVVARLQFFPEDGSPVITNLAVALVLTLPFLLLRLLDDFAGAPRTVIWLALAGIAVLVPATFLVGPSLPTPFLLLALPYSGAIASYVAWAWVKEARSSTGATRRRMQSAALGSLFLGLAVVAGALGRVVPDADYALRVFGLCSALGYFFAFTPPAVLRRTWQAPGLRSFLERASAISPGTEVESVLRQLEVDVMAVTGARDAAVGLWDDVASSLRFRGDLLRPVSEGISGRAYREQRVTFSTNAARDDPAWAEWYRERGIRAVIAAPMTARGRRLGTLAVYDRRGALFADDDLVLVQVIANHAALVLDGMRAYAELSATNVRLADATRVKSEFLANMSHELRTPLNAILGFSDLLSEQLGGRISAPQLRYLRNVRSSGEHLLQIINDLLDIAKVEAGRLELRLEAIEVATLVEPVIASTQAAADAAGVHLTVESTDGAITADPVRLRQVLYNLLSNAVKFTERGGSVSLRTTFEGRAFIAEVIDSGMGIPPTQQHLIFGTFERLHEGRSAATGTGLGLALTKSLVELHHGTIAFESEEGRGTTFRVVLPETRIEPVRGDRILVVEDVQVDSDLIVALAAECGLASEVVTTVSAALHALQEDPPRGVVLDLRLPDGRGERVLDALKADSRTRGIPVIVVTVEDDEGNSRRRGADDHLTKPIDRQRLGAWLSRVKHGPALLELASSR